MMPRRIGCLVDPARVQAHHQLVVGGPPFDFRPDLVVPAGQVAKALRILGKAVDPIGQPRRDRPGDIGIGVDRVIGADLQARTHFRLIGRQVMDDVDRSAGRAAAEQRRARALQHLDPLDAVQRVRQAVALVAVREAVGIDARVEPADQEVVVEAEAVAAAAPDAAGIADRILQRHAALRVDGAPVDDLDTRRYLGQRRARLAGRRRLVEFGRLAGDKDLGGRRCALSGVLRALRQCSCRHHCRQAGHRRRRRQPAHPPRPMTTRFSHSDSSNCGGRDAQARSARRPARGDPACYRPATPYCY